LLNFDRYRGIETFLRLLGFIVFFGLFLSRFLLVGRYGDCFLYRVSPTSFYAYRMLWFLESMVFLFYCGAYLFRRRAERLASGFWEAVFPFITAFLPFLMIRHGFLNSFFRNSEWNGGRFQDLTRLTWNGQSMYIVQVDISYIPLLIAVSVMLAGSLVMVISLFSLWKSFSIMTEARELVTGGIYRFIRHPLYLGEIIAYAGVLLLRFSPVNLVIFLVFIVCLVTRGKIEERKLGEVFPEYVSYKRKTGMFFPKLFNFQSDIMDKIKIT
jgi:protein-S-isoprenylcysteine O-methyltransferase Ste14